MRGVELAWNYSKILMPKFFFFVHLCHFMSLATTNRPLTSTAAKPPTSAAPRPGAAVIPKTSRYERLSQTIVAEEVRISNRVVLFCWRPNCIHFPGPEPFWAVLSDWRVSSVVEVVVVVDPLLKDDNQLPPCFAHSIWVSERGITVMCPYGQMWRASFSIFMDWSSMGLNLSKSFYRCPETAHLAVCSDSCRRTTVKFEYLKRVTHSRKPWEIFLVTLVGILQFYYWTLYTLNIAR